MLAVLSLLAALVLTSLFSLYLPESRAGLIFLLSCYTAIVLFAAAVVSNRLSRVKAIALAFGVYVITHVGYTIGFLHGWFFPNLEEQ